MSIEFKNVNFVYSPKSPFEYAALHDINFTFLDKGFIALVGRTGSGKSTLIQHVNALLNPTTGDVIIDDFINSSIKKKRSKKLTDLRKKVGLVFQFPEYQLFEDTIEKDVAFAPRNFGSSKEESIKLAHEALAKVGLDESFYGRSPFELSGGEKRKVAIAGILASSPSVLIVDEPTAGLDPVASKETMELFKKVHEEGTTVILVTHDMNLVAEFANQVIVMDQGKIAKITTPEKLFQEDISQYSLEKPLLFSFIENLRKKGMDLGNEPLLTVEEVAKAIARKKDE